MIHTKAVPLNTRVLHAPTKPFHSFYQKCMRTHIIILETVRRRQRAVERRTLAPSTQNAKCIHNTFVGSI